MCSGNSHEVNHWQSTNAAYKNIAWLLHLLSQTGQKVGGWGKSYRAGLD